MEQTDKPDHNLVEQQVKDVIQDLFQVMVQVSTYDAAGRSSTEVLANELQTLSQSLRTVHDSATKLHDSDSGGPRVPDLLVQYVENGRNPDIYTREFAERVRRMNQLARGKMHAFAAFRDVLAAEMETALPELSADIRRVVDAAPVNQPQTAGAAAGAGGDAAASGSGGGGAAASAAGAVGGPDVAAGAGDVPGTGSGPVGGDSATPKNA